MKRFVLLAAAVLAGCQQQAVSTPPAAAAVSATPTTAPRSNPAFTRALQDFAYWRAIELGQTVSCATAAGNGSLGWDYAMNEAGQAATMFQGAANAGRITEQANEALTRQLAQGMSRASKEQCDRGRVSGAGDLARAAARDLVAIVQPKP